MNTICRFIAGDIVIQSPQSVYYLLNIFSMKKTFLFLSRLDLTLPLRLLLLFAVPLLHSVEVSAQDTTLAGMPQIELIPVHQREAMGHYLNKVWTSKGWQIESFDGTKARAEVSVLHFEQEVLITVSPNQLYFTVAKPVASPNGGTMAYDVELRNLSNSLLAKGRLSSLGSDGEESHDEFVPSDDGLGIVHKANLALSGGLRFVFFQRRSSALIKRFEVDKTAFWNANVIYEPAQQMIVATFEGHIAGTKISKTYVQSYSTNGMLQWETTLDSQHVQSGLFVSAFDGNVAFVSRNVRDKSQNNLFIFRKNGKLIRHLHVHHIGSYERAHFGVISGRQYFLSSSGVEYYYIIDTESGEIINYHTQAKEDTRVMGLSIYQEFIFTTYYRLYLRPSSNNTQEPAPKDQGFGIIDLHGRFTYVPLNLTGYPFLFATEAGLFLREQIGFSLNPQINFYKIKVK